MKKLLFFGLFIFSSTIFAQIPTGYYDGTAGLTGSALKTKLSSIITNGHSAKSYDNLYNGYPSTDTDKYYENDGTVLDMYSEKPTATDPYTYQHGIKKCGSYNSEGDCYNREHIIPQSFFNSNSPMVSDIHFITPTDGKVNGMRSNNPFGPVSSPTFTSENGSKLGPCTASGFTGTVFEPIDDFKGDIARMIFYFVTRYESKLSSFSTGNMLGGSAFPGLQSWELQVLLTWNANDPVSQREIDRNNAAYLYQGNRNPYIDNPSFVASVWGGSAPSNDTEAPSTPTNLTVTNTNSSSVSLSWTASTDNVAIAGYEIYLNGVFQFTVTGTTATINGLASSTAYNFYVIAKDTTGNTSTSSNTVNATTLAGTGTPTTCGTENFTNTPNQTASSYATNTWTNAGVTWTATDSRTDQTITGPAILLRNGSLTSSTISGGIGNLTVTTKQIFSGSAGTFNVLVNGNMVGTIPFSTTTTTTTIPNINATGNVVISISDNSTSGNSTVSRVAFDDLTWTCYTDLATSDISKTTFNIYPNPVKNNQLFVTGKNLERINRVEIYNTTGELLQVAERPFSGKNYLQLKNLRKGLYFMKIENSTHKFLVE